MQEHPFLETRERKVTIFSLAVLTMAILWGGLVVYGNISSVPAFVDCVLFVGLLIIAGYTSWFFISFIRMWQSHLLLAGLVQLVCLGVTFLFLSLFGMEGTEEFLFTMPIHLLIGILCWIILLQWYGYLSKSDHQEKIVPETETCEVIDRISVKDRSRIHIVPLEELYCIQASGDYVTLFTASDQYIKEQTMKYFDMHLPAASFVRIHRSSIVNTSYILRVELFGKETYQVRLKNGITLKASNTGYKLLKDRLSL